MITKNYERIINQYRHVHLQTVVLDEVNGTISGQQPVWRATANRSLWWGSNTKWTDTFVIGDVLEFRIFQSCSCLIAVCTHLPSLVAALINIQCSSSSRTSFRPWMIIYLEASKGNWTCFHGLEDGCHPKDGRRSVKFTKVSPVALIQPGWIRTFTDICRRVSHNQSGVREDFQRPESDFLSPHFLLFDTPPGKYNSRNHLQLSWPSLSYTTQQIPQKSDQRQSQLRGI